MRITKITDKIIEYEIYNKKQKFIVIFDSKTFEISGWKTIDIFQNDVEFIIYNVKKNIVIGKDEFEIPRLN
jgi:outer membrane lipoprotein-sorting protein